MFNPELKKGDRVMLLAMDGETSVMPLTWGTVKGISPEVQGDIMYYVDWDTGTKEKVGERYRLSRRKKRNSQKKRCSGGCGTLISIYNANGFCNICMVNTKKVDKMLKELKGYFEYEQDF